jgi:hypothetical protein
MLLVGWTVQLACGVAFWILPRLVASGSRGDERPAWFSFGALNAGVALAALYDPLRFALGDAPYLWALPVLASALYLLAVLAFVLHAWPRVAPFRSLPRPGQRVERGGSRSTNLHE